jgi:hypothetical protein
MSLYATAFLGTTPIGAPLIGLIIAGANPRIGILVGAGVTFLTGVVLVAQLRHHPREEKVLQPT